MAAGLQPGVIPELVLALPDHRHRWIVTAAMDDHVAVTRSDPPGRKADDHVGVETFERQQVPRKARVLQRVRA
ncbi:MAG: hypothetical protein ACK5X1_14100, partial [Betaproteobacteria bacterium]